MFTVILCSGTQTVIKKIDINTVITLESLFPSYIRIIFRDFTRPICNSITGNTEQIAPSIGSFTTGINTVNYFIQIYTIRICQIHKTSSIPVRFIIAYKSKTSTQLQKADYRFQRLEKLFLTHQPSYRPRRKSRETLIRRKIFRTIITNIELCHVTVHPVISYTPY